MTPDWEIELNGHIEIFKHPELEWEEYVPFLVAKRMIAQREQQVFNNPNIVTLHILRNWSSEQIKTFALHLIGSQGLHEEAHKHFLEWRGIEGEACPTCNGSGVRLYSNTSTWRGGIGGNALTDDVCDRCWGSGSKENPWPSWRIRQPTATPPPAAHDSPPTG